ncbi:hypothetical protein [Dactylosporangium matsuzakiense]|uniref:hypothetical protein n=1 Tax=Dactylosporangium matsuzakiense TaxID=53360 RepID=UPI0021C26485|nr:hypothetical protein [Dactylosporangium matsuzakiense]UWZ46205.1 hypothetical protein Dmats_07080 [Dactylosporangium matsuzakiense]
MWPEDSTGDLSRAERAERRTGEFRAPERHTGEIRNTGAIRNTGEIRDTGQFQRPARPPAPALSPVPPPHGAGRRPWVWLVGAAVIVLLVGAVFVIGWVRAGSPQAAGNEASTSTAPEAGENGGGMGEVDPNAGLGAGPSSSASASKNPSAAAKSTANIPGRVPGGFPGPGNTGVPGGTTLTAYSGPCTIDKDNTVIDSKTVNCDLGIKAKNVKIQKSKINGAVVLDTDQSGSGSWSYTLSDSEVDAGTRQNAAVSYGNMTIIRSNIHGGQTSVQCGESGSYCTIQDSWLHGQRIPDNANWHLGGLLSNGGHNIRVKHNTIVCDAPVNSAGEGCTGDLNLFGDFAVISDVVVDSNFLGANTGSSYCLYGGDTKSKPYPNANKVQIINNVFALGTNKKCAAYGAVAGFNVNGSGNVWHNNTWEDGTPVNPEN